MLDIECIHSLLLGVATVGDQSAHRYPLLAIRLHLHNHGSLDLVQKLAVDHQQTDTGFADEFCCSYIRVL